MARCVKRILDYDGVAFERIAFKNPLELLFRIYCAKFVALKGLRSQIFLEQLYIWHLEHLLPFRLVLKQQNVFVIFAWNLKLCIFL